MVRNRINKKGQITIFVIIGLVLLIAVGILFYINSQITPGITGPVAKDLEPVPEEFKPIRSYVESCMKQVAEDGIRKLALHGGYIDPLNSDYSYFDFEYDPMNPTESDIIDFGIPPSSIKIPYWYYLSGKNGDSTQGVASWMPTIQFMQLQLSAYIQNNINDCLEGFSELEKTGFEVTVLDSPSVDTVIVDGGQSFLLTYKLEVTKEDAQQIINDYYTTSELPLKKLYDAAKNITQYESSTNHLALFTKHIISTHSGPSMDLLPPFFHSDNEKLEKFWLKPVVKLKIQDLLYSYSQTLQVLGTKNFDDSFMERIDEDLRMERMIYLLGTLPVFASDDENANTISASLIYSKNHPIFVDVFPNKGVRIKPQHQSSGGGFFDDIFPSEDSNKYKFFYDVSYPLTVELKNYDEVNKNNELEFVFAIEVNLIKNYIVNDYLLGRGPILWSNDLINLEIINTDTSAPPADSNIIYGEQASRNIFCKESQMKSGNITMIVSDRNTGEALENVEVSYGCGTYAECFIGLTELKYGSGYLSSKMPICNNGYVLFEKQGYETKRVELTTRQDTPTNLGNVALYRKVKKNVSLQKFEIDYLYKMDNDFGIPTRCYIPGLNSLLLFSGECFDLVKSKLKIKGTNMSNESANLTMNESAIIIFELMNNGINPDYKVFVRIKGNETEEVELIPGRYTIDITYLDANGVSIPKNCDKACEKCSWYETCTVKHCKHYPPNQIDLIPAPWGGLDFNESRPVYFRPSDLYGNNTELRLSVFSYPRPNEISCIESLEELDKKTEYTTKYRSLLLPKFITIN